MKKVLLALFSGFVGLFLVIGVFAPKEFSIEREVIVNKPKAVVFDYLRSLKSGQEWSPWSKRDPQIKIEFKGTDGTVGATSSWSGNREVGVGEQEIKSIVEGSRIDFELRFKEPMEDKSTGHLITESVSDHQTKVKWGMKGKSPFPKNIVCFIFNMKKSITTDFDSGLAQLKSNLEK